MGWRVNFSRFVGVPLYNQQTPLLMFSPTSEIKIVVSLLLLVFHPAERHLVSQQQGKPDLRLINSMAYFPNSMDGFNPMVC